MDEVDDDDFYGSEDPDIPDSTNYYLYAFVATVIVGLPLLLVALYRIYIDHQHHQDKQDAYREKMREYREAKQGLTANLRHEVNASRQHYEMERIEKEHNERQIRSDHAKQVRELESKIRTQESRLNAKNAEIEELNAQHRETQKKINLDHSQQMQKAKHTIATLTSSCEDLRKDLEMEKRNAKEANERYAQLNAQYYRERVERSEHEHNFKSRIRTLGDSLHSSQLETERLTSELISTKQKLQAAQRSFWQRHRAHGVHRVEVDEGLSTHSVNNYMQHEN